MTKARKPIVVGQSLVTATRNKIKRNIMLTQYRKIRNQDRKAQRAKRKEVREELGDQAPPQKETQKIEDKREYDETFLAKLDEEDIQEDNMDEFAEYYDEKTTPKIVITTCRRPHKVRSSPATL